MQERHDQMKKVVDDIQKQRSRLQTTASQKKKEILNLKVCCVVYNVIERFPDKHIPRRATKGPLN